jgi:uncharacterized protein (DUF2267 family)
MHDKKDKRNTEKAAAPPGAAGREAERSGREEAGRERRVQQPSSRRPMKEYRDFVDAVTDTKAVKDRDGARAAIDAVLAEAVRRLTEEDAVRITGNLPEPLNLTALRGGGAASPSRVGTSEETAEPVVRAVLKTLRACIPEEQHAIVARALPGEWKGLFQESDGGVNAG